MSLALLIAPVLNSGCDKASHSEDKHAGANVQTGLGTAPQSADGNAKGHTPATSLGKEKGQELFTRLCAACHSADAKGRVGMGPSLAAKSFLEAASDEMLLTTITKGRAGTTMTAWGPMLKAGEPEAIVDYLRSLTPHEPAKLDESPVKGDVEAGKKSFIAVCARCHGNNGGGYQESSSGTGIGRKSFLEAASDGYLRYIIKHGKSQTGMRAFDEKAPTAVANLSDDEIENVIAYLRANAW